METPKTGYQVQSYSVPVKRYCQTLDLRDSPELIAEYRKRHSQAEAWPEILAGIREVGILEMEIYILGTRLFMIVETPLDFDWDTAMARLNTVHPVKRWHQLSYPFYSHHFLFCVMGICKRYHQPNGKGIFQNLPDECYRRSVSTSRFLWRLLCHGFSGCHVHPQIFL